MRLLPFTIPALLILSATPVLKSDAQTDPFGIPDTVRIGNVDVSPHTSFSVEVYLLNDEQLTGLTVPLGLSGDFVDLALDSVVFAQDRIADCQYFNSLIDAQSRSVLLGIVPLLDSSEIYFEPGNGLLCELFFTLGDIENACVETVNAVQLPPFNSLVFVGQDITPFVPEFVPGYILMNPTATDNEHPLPGEHTIGIRAYPNPFNSSLNIDVYLKSPGLCNLKIYNLLGQAIHELQVRGSCGINRIGTIDFRSNASGIYFISASQNGNVTTRKVIFLR